MGRSLILVIAGSFVLSVSQFAAAQLRAVVEAEEEIYRYQSAGNGAGPSWCFGSTCIGRIGDDVFASGLETIKAAKPLNNTRWMLFHRSDGGWELCRRDERGRTREPCPIGVFPDGAVLLSVNPTLTPPDTYAGPAQPQILRFSAKAPGDAPATILPEWEGAPKFSEHSYRSFAIDGPAREMILFQNIGYTHAEWAFCAADGKWTARGRLVWPWGAEYAKPQPIRVCYPAVQLRNRAVYFCGVSDIVEPNEKWRQYKRKLTGQEWDYDFRRLFFTWTEDIAGGRFSPWVEIASREKTAGHIFPCDLSAEADGKVHVLWTERALDPRLRKDFFPAEKQSDSLCYAVIEKGRVLSQTTILSAGEGAGGEIPGRGRFHIMPDGRLLVLFHVGGVDAGGKALNENRLIELRDGKPVGAGVRVPLQTPLGSFFTATVRGGSAPSNAIDILADTGGVVRYARVRVE